MSRFSLPTDRYDGMFWMGLPIFSLYFTLLFADEVLFHRRRAVTRREALGRIPMAVVLTATGIFVQFVQYSSRACLLYAGLVALVIILLAREELDRDSGCSNHERMLHVFQHSLLTAIFAVVVICWHFIDGAGLVINLVLHFSTSWLRPLLGVFFVILTALSVYQLVRSLRLARKPAVALRVETEDKKAS